MHTAVHVQPNLSPLLQHPSWGGRQAAAGLRGEGDQFTLRHAQTLLGPCERLLHLADRRLPPGRLFAVRRGSDGSPMKAGWKCA